MADAQRASVPGGSDDKPHLRAGFEGTVLGGYMDHELFWTKSKKTFDQHRFVPFIHGQISDRIHVMAEIEFEHGGLVKGSGTSDGEVKLEFATIDIEFAESVVYRAGIILSPLGRFNLLHDSPLNDLTNRPLVARHVIPTTLSESGMGLHGTLYPSDETLIGYEVYIVNGFNESASTSLRSGRGSQKSDNNDEKSIVGRLNYSPMLGLDIGGSLHIGSYTDAGDGSLAIYALDGNFHRGAIDVRGEFATASIDGAAQNNRSGWYAQAAYHLLPGVLSHFPNSVFTVTGRYDQIDLGNSEETRFTVGLNFRPEEETALKLDYEMYDEDDDSNGVIFSVASYF